MVIVGAALSGRPSAVIWGGHCGPPLQLESS